MEASAEGALASIAALMGLLARSRLSVGSDAQTGGMPLTSVGVWVEDRRFTTPSGVAMAPFIPVWILGASFAGLLILAFSFKGT